MKFPFFPSLVALALVAGSPLPVTGAEPTGDQILRQMSAKLAAARSFDFQATREIDPALLPGHAQAGKVRVHAAVQRPNKLAGRAEARRGARRFVFDGRTLTILDEKMNHYATVPMRKSIDGLIDELDEKFGFTPPLAEFAVSDPYQEFRREANSVTLLGRARVPAGFLGLRGVECYRLGLKGKETDAELWVAVGDLLPRKLVATFHRPGNPQVKVDFASWNLAAPVTPGEFTFTPPKGAVKIEMIPTAKIQAARKH
jgi:hypothetical protein